MTNTPSGEDVAAMLADALGLALTGEAGEVDPERARRARSRARAEERVWPHAVPREFLATIGYARWAAALHEAVEALGPVEAPTQRPGELSADERRLIQDRPPHW